MDDIGRVWAALVGCADLSDDNCEWRIDLASAQLLVMFGPSVLFACVVTRDAFQLGVWIYGTAVAQGALGDPVPPLCSFKNIGRTRVMP